MKVVDKNGSEIEIGSLVSYIRRLYGGGTTPMENCTVTKIKCKKTPDGVLYRVIVHKKIKKTYKTHDGTERSYSEDLDTSFSSATGVFSTLTVVGHSDKEQTQVVLT